MMLYTSTSTNYHLVHQVLSRSLVFSFLYLLLTCTALYGHAPYIDEPVGYIPVEWEEDIVSPVLTARIERITVGPAASGVPGNTDMILRYTLNNEGKMDAENIQVVLDLIGQIGSDLFVRSGSLSAMTGSGSRTPISDIGGVLNDAYDGDSENTFFDALPTLGPDSYLTVDIPVEVADTNATSQIFLGANTTATDGSGTPVPVTASALSLFATCESISLACTGSVNISLGTDCQAEVGLSSVFLNGDLDPYRFKVEVYIGNQSFGTMLDESHIGLPLEYRVIDLCLDGRASCWGRINLENKNIPTPTSSYQEIHCGETPRNIESLAETEARVNMGCHVGLTDFKEFFTSIGDKCDSAYTFRNVTATFEIDGWKNTVTVHTDTILTLPLDTLDISNPLGEPDIWEPVKIACEDFTLGGAPSPSFVEDYIYSETGSRDTAIASAYPYIDKGMTTIPSYTTRDTIVETRRRDTATINGQLVYVTIVEKDTIQIIDTTYITERILVPIKVGTTCNLSTTYHDEFFPGCVGEDSKIKRTWRLLDWCSGAITLYVQWIHITDSTAPEITFTDSLSVYVTPWDCTTSYDLNAQVTDACSGVKDVSYTASAGVIEDGVLSAIDNSDSPVYINIHAIDECGNETVKVQTLFVLDNTAPVAVTKDQLNTNIIYDPTEDAGIAKVTAEAINAGSHDSNCGEITYCTLLDEELANPIFAPDGSQAMDDDGNLLYEAIQCYHDGEYNGIPYVICKDAVKFCCDQVGVHKVALVVSDGSPHSSAGIGWTNVNVEDKSHPIIECTSINITCGTDTDPEVIGYPEISQGLCDNSTITYSDHDQTGDCGTGPIYRTWMIDGDSVCTQEIIVEGHAAFDPRSIKWPKHYDDAVINGVHRTCESDTIRESVGLVYMGVSVSCDAEIDTGEPIWCPNSCSMILATHEDQTISADDGCKKIIRTWTVIDWCNYEANGSDVEVDAGDAFEAVDDTDLSTANAYANLYDGDLCDGCDKPNTDTDVDIFFRYTDVDIDGYYTYQQVIKVVDETAPEVVVDETVDIVVTGGATFKGDNFDGCAALGTVTAVAIDYCGTDQLDAGSTNWTVRIFDGDDSTLIEVFTLYGDTVSVDVAGGAYTSQYIEWTIADGCLNKDVAITTVNFVDVVDPSPLCISGVSIATMDITGVAEIWASDFDAGSFDNCSPVTYYFKEDSTYVGSLTFDCDDIPDGRSEIIELELYAVDHAGNESSCNVSIRIDDNADICHDTGAVGAGYVDISGSIMTPTGHMVEDVIVELNNNRTSVTGTNGEFAFVDVPTEDDYLITSIKDSFDINGISAVDLVLIQRHVIGTARFDDPYKVIAADANGDQRISALDLVHIKRLLLGITDEFANTNSWRFVNPDQTFDNVSSPWPFEEVINITDLVADMTDLRLFGIKVGDINDSAIANEAMADTRSQSTQRVYLQDQYLSSGERTTITLDVDAHTDMTALQFDLQTKGLNIASVWSPSLYISDQDYTAQDDILSLVWFADDVQTIDEALLHIEVVATEDVQLSQVLQFAKGRIASEMVDEHLESAALQLEFTVSDAMTIFAVEQNDPNPFAIETHIDFVLPTADRVELTVVDISGRVILTQSAEFEAGAQQFTIRKSDVPASGVMYYRVQSSHGAVTKKMIVLE